MGVVLLVRHGQASFGSDDYDVLSETGWEQGRLLGAWLAERKVTPGVLVRGDMRRHRETAEAMAAAAGWEPAIEIDGAWNEFDHLGVVASYPGLPRDRELDRREFQHYFELATQRWTAGRHDAEYPESYAAFTGRVRSGLERASSQAGPGDTVVVVSSGGPIAAVCAALVDPTGEDLGVIARMWNRLNTVVVNSSVTRIVVGSTGARLLTFNEHAHLEGETLTYR